MNGNKLIAIVTFSLFLTSAAVRADHKSGHDVASSSGVPGLAEELQEEISSRIDADEALQAAIDAEAAARSAADQALSDDTAAAQADATDAQNRVGALEGKTMLSDVEPCVSGQVAKSNGAGGWFCADDVSGDTNADTLGGLGCTEDGDIAVFFQGQWVCGSELPAVQRFVDNGDGTVTDNQSGLTWEKKEPCGVDGLLVDFDNPHCVANTYTWTSDLDGDSTDPDGTLYADFLAMLNLDVTVDPSATCFANHCDWRLPNIQELQTILLADCAGFPTPCIDEELFGPTQALGYWSSSTHTVFRDDVWRIVFSSGIALSDDKTDVQYARAVRGGR
jgi:hypothetical protein